MATNMLTRGAAYLESRRAEYLSVAIVYHRGASSVAINATLGKTPFNQMDRMATTLTWESLDFLVLIEDLADFWADAGGTVWPYRGDYITMANDPATRYQVLSPGDEPVYVLSGAHGQTWRVHTKRDS